MENSTKALIIIGAVLLAILIIGLGIYVYNQGSNAVGDAGLDKLSVRQFNAKFETYLDRKMGAVLTKNLIDVVNKSNSTEKHQVTLEGLTKDDLIVGKDYISTSTEENGYIKTITISEYED